MNTRWINGLEDAYAVTDDGKVFSYKTNRFLKPNKHYRTGYLSVMLRTHDGKSIRCAIHRLVARAFIGPVPFKHEVDHINRSKEDNRASNLRYVHRGVNMHNRLAKQTLSNRPRSKFKGVSFSEGTHLSWKAVFCVNHKHYTAGQFKTQREAALAYDSGVTQLRGHLAVTNKSLGYL